MNKKLALFLVASWGAFVNGLSVHAQHAVHGSYANCIYKVRSEIDSGASYNAWLQLAGYNVAAAQWLFARSLRDTDRYCVAVANMVDRGVDFNNALITASLQWLGEAVEAWRALQIGPGGYAQAGQTLIPGHVHITVERSMAERHADLIRQSMESYRRPRPVF